MAKLANNVSIQKGPSYCRPTSAAGGLDWHSFLKPGSCQYHTISDYGHTNANSVDGYLFSRLSFPTNPFRASRDEVQSRSSWFFIHSHNNTYPKQTHLGLASFDLSKGHKNMTHFWAWQNRWPIVKFLKSQDSTINRNSHDEDSCSLI